MGKKSALSLSMFEVDEAMISLAVAGSVSSSATLLDAAPKIVNENLVNLAIGALAGMVASAVVFPIDTAKTRIQAAEGEQKLNTVQTIKKIVDEEGFFALYNGLIPVMIGAAPESAIQLSVYEFVLSMLKQAQHVDSSSSVSFYGQALAGSIAGLATIIATNPLEVLKIRAQMSREKKSTWDHVKELGLTGLYTGYQATWLRDIPFAAMYFPLYSSAKSCMNGVCTSNLGAAMIAGLFSGMMASFITTPADVIKTTVQSSPSDRSLSASSKRAEKMSIQAAATNVMRTKGPRGFFSGVEARLGRMAPAMSISLCVFEGLRTFFGRGAGLKMSPVVLANADDLNSHTPASGVNHAVAMQSAGVAQPVMENAGTIAGGAVGQTYIDSPHVMNSVCNVMDHVATVCNSVP
eukprot:750196-Hanusia_phi.AAC.4